MFVEYPECFLVVCRHRILPGSAKLVQKRSRLSFRLIASYCGKMSVGGNGSSLGKGKLPFRVTIQGKGKDFVPMNRARNLVGENSKESTSGCWRLAR